MKVVIFAGVFNTLLTHVQIEEYIKKAHKKKPFG
jgi:hypothetical protein